MTDFKTRVEYKLRDTLITYAKNEIKDDRVEAFADEIKHTPHIVIDDLLNIIEYLETELDKANFVKEEINKTSDGVVVSNKYRFECHVNGILLEFWEMMKIREYYEACCYAEKIADEYDIETAKSIELGYEVRERMADDNATKEDDIIKEIVETSLKEQMEKDIQDICNKTLQLHSDYGDKAIEKLKKMLKILE